MSENGDENQLLGAEQLSDVELKTIEAMRKMLEAERDRLRSLIQRNEREILLVRRERELLRIQRERGMDDSDTDSEPDANKKTSDKRPSAFRKVACRFDHPPSAQQSRQRTLTRKPPTRRRARSRSAHNGMKKSQSNGVPRDINTQAICATVADEFLVHHIDSDDESMAMQIMWRDEVSKRLPLLCSYTQRETHNGIQHSMQIVSTRQTVFQRIQS